MFLFSSFDKAKTKSQLKLAMQRIGLLRNKKMQKVEAEKKSIALLLKNQKDEPARIKAEHLIKDVSTMEGLEMLQQLCDLLLARFALVETEKVCDPDIKEIVCTIIWAAPRCEVQELLEVKKQLIARYGKKLGEEATEDVKDNEWLNPRVVFKLMYRRPTDQEISQTLSSVAKEHGVEWTDEVAGQMDGYSAIPTVPDMPPLQPEAGAPAPAPAPTPGPGPAQAAGGICPRCGNDDPRCPQCVPAEVLANLPPKQQYTPSGDPLPPPSNPAAGPPPHGGVRKPIIMMTR